MYSLAVGIRSSSILRRHHEPHVAAEAGATGNIQLPAAGLWEGEGCTPLVAGTLPVRAAVWVGAAGRRQLTVTRPARDDLERARASGFPDNTHRAIRPERRAGEQQRPDIATRSVGMQFGQAKRGCCLRREYAGRDI